MMILPRLSFLFISASIFSMFILSGDVLNLLGYNFALPGGSAIFKIHPSFYLLFMGYVSLLIYKNGWNIIHDSLLKKQNFFLLLACFFCFCYQIIILNQSITPLIVTWIYPVLLFCLHDRFSQEQRSLIYKVLLWIITINALLGIVEYARSESFFPRLYLSAETGDLMDITAWGFSRASSLYGHPLSATLISAIVVVGFYAKSIHATLTKNEMICCFMSILSLPAFGGRTSIAIALMMLFFITSLKFYMSLSQRNHISRVKAIVISAAILLTPLIVLVLYNLGLFDTLLARIEDDNGSAETRWTALYILFDTPSLEIIFGDFNKQLFERQLLYGTKYGIEVFWLAMLLQYGLLISLAMTYILFVFHRYIYKNIDSYTLWPSATFLLSVSASVGLATKTLSLAQFLVLSLFLFAPKETDK
jgi:hypothetical protein